MMRLYQNKLILIFTYFLTTLTFQLLAQKSELLYQPDKNASVVLQVNMKSIAEKVPEWKKYFLENFANSKGLDKNIKKIIESSGVDWRHHISLFACLEKENTYVALSLSLEDEKKFEASIITENKTLEVQQKEGGRYIEQKEGIIVWNAHNALLLNAPEMNLEKRLKLMNSLQNKEELLSKHNKVYKKLIAKKTDMSIWGNYKYLLEMNPSGINSFLRNLGVVSVDKKYSDVIQYMTAFANFDKGRMKLDFTAFLNQSKVATYRKLINKKGISKPLAQKIPSENPLALLSFAFNSEEMYRVLSKNEDFQKTFEKMKEEVGLNAEEFFKMLNGELAFVWNDLQSNTFETELVLGLGIQNEHSLAMMLSFFEKKGVIQKDKVGYKSAYDGLFSVYLVPRSQSFLLITNKKLLTKLGSKSALQANLSKGLRKNIYYFYFDIETISQKVPFMEEVPLVQECSSIEFKVKRPNASKMRGVIDMLFHNEQKNALVSLFKIISYNP